MQLIRVSVISGAFITGSIGKGRRLRIFWLRILGRELFDYAIRYEVGEIKTRRGTDGHL